MLARLDYIELNSDKGIKKMWIKDFKFEQPHILSVVELNGRVHDFDMRDYSVQITITYSEQENERD